MDVAPDDRRPAGYQRWRDLLFLHWPVPRDVIRPLLPNGLEIDSLAGQAYVSLIPFVIAESRPARVPRALAARFLETNLRTYVRAPDGEPGIYFFSLEASSLLAVAAARLLYGLPYFPAAMSMRRDESRRSIGAAVVDDQDFVRDRKPLQRPCHVVECAENVLGFAVGGNHD